MTPQGAIADVAAEAARRVDSASQTDAAALILAAKSIEECARNLANLVAADAGRPGGVEVVRKLSLSEARAMALGACLVYSLMPGVEDEEPRERST